MNSSRTSSRLQKIEDRKNQRQAALFIFLSIGFLVLIVFIGFPLFVKAAVYMGNRRTASDNVKNDSVPPVHPQIITDFESTSSATISLKGYSEPGTTVTLFRNAEKYLEVLTDADGNFIFNEVKLMGGENRFYAEAADLSGNKSQVSDSVLISFDNEPPKLEITNPSDGAEFYYDNREVLVAGTTDPDANVRVNDFVVVVDTEGNFVKKLQLTDGENDITIKASDQANNVTERSVKVHYSH